jgi:hypothetical protein
MMPKTPMRTPTIMAARMLLLVGRRHGSVDGCGCVAIIAAIPRGERKVVQEDDILGFSSIKDSTTCRLFNSTRRVISPLRAQLRY